MNHPSPGISAEKTREILQKVRQIEIKTNRLVNDTLAGQYHSAFKGQGMNFDEVREYHPGDEIRNIDWNVTARTGKAFVKQYIEERELTILLMIDVSASGFFGSAVQSKRNLAAELGSLFAFSAIRNHDKVGLVLFTDQVELYIPPKKGKNHVLRVIRDILYFNPKGRKTDIRQALDYAHQVLNRKAVVILISDFWLNEPYKANLTDTVHKLDLANRKHDLAVITVSDPLERQLPSCGVIAMEDIESGEEILIDTRNPSVVSNYKRLNEERTQELRNQMRKKNIDLLELQTDTPYTKDLIRFFKIRGKRR